MIVILGAMEEEVRSLTEQLTPSASAPGRLLVAGRTFHLGTLDGHDVAIGFSRWGKVAAATTCAALLTRLASERGSLEVRRHIEAVLFAGVAGSLDEGVGIGDVVVAERLFQHDLDASPLFAPMQVPLSERNHFQADATWANALLTAAHAVATGRGTRAHTGDIATGDQFICDQARRASIKSRIPSALAVEMEGAAIAQVCHDHSVPMAALRIISDRADTSAPDDFVSFIKTQAGPMAVEIVRSALRNSKAAKGKAAKQYI